MKKKHIPVYIMIIFASVYVGLIIMLANNYILNVQAYFDFNIVPIFFWIFAFALGVKLIYSDIGFLKIGAVLGIATGVFVIAFMIRYSTSDYSIVESDEYTVIVNKVKSPDKEMVHVYRQDNSLFSKYIDSVPAADYFELSYEIEDDTLTITRCTDVSCVHVDVLLEDNDE